MAQPARPRRSSRQRPDPVDLPGIVPLTSTRLSDDLAGQIRRLIIGEGISEGARLPSERDLAERFGASRPTVSQALRTLALMGLVESGIATLSRGRPLSMIELTPERAIESRIFLIRQQHPAGRRGKGVGHAGLRGRVCSRSCEGF